MNVKRIFLQGVAAAAIAAFGAAAIAQTQEPSPPAAPEKPKPTVAELLALFESGNMTFECKLLCLLPYTQVKPGWKVMREEKAWRELVLSVAQTGFNSDLSYFMLAEAAKGMGKPALARVYYERSVEADRAGEGCQGFFNACEGIPVRRLSLRAVSEDAASAPAPAAAPAAAVPAAAAAAAPAAAPGAPAAAPPAPAAPAAGSAAQPPENSRRQMIAVLQPDPALSSSSPGAAPGAASTAPAAIPPSSPPLGPPPSTIAPAAAGAAAAAAAPAPAPRKPAPAPDINTMRSFSSGMDSPASVQQTEAGAAAEAKTRSENEIEAARRDAETMEAFRRGELEFDCRFTCMFSYTINRPFWRKMYDAKNWEELVLAVANTGYHVDLSYFLLAEAAKNMGFEKAARAYYTRAIEAAKTNDDCETGTISTCEGLAVQELSYAALGQKMPPRPAPAAPAAGQVQSQ